MAAEASDNAEKHAVKPPAPAEQEAKADSGKDPHQHDAQPGPSKFAVPFAWESSPDEPLSVVRSFLGDALRDNRNHASQGAKAFLAYRDEQKPRATVLTCSDSRVHTSAFDATPENDVFMIRNVGNQLGNAEGSIEYGVEHLGTPVLLVIGHTGCGAVKAAMGDLSKQSRAVRAELAGMSLPKPAAGSDENAAWSSAVIANVRAQVARSVRIFGARVQQGQLTVVGVVYDFRNDLGHGAGRINVVDVNGNDDPERMKSFVEAVSVGPLASAAFPRSSAPSLSTSSAARSAAPAAAPQAWSPQDLERALRSLDAKQKPKH